MERAAQLRRAILLSLASVVWNGIVGALAVYVSVSTGSLSLAGFGADAVIDSVASVALIWRFSMERRQPHRAAQVERLAEGVVGGALTLLGFYIAGASIRALMGGESAHATPEAIAILVASLLVLPPLALAKRRTAERLSSGALRGDSLLTGVAALLAAISLGSLVLSESLGLWWADSAGALVVAILVLREGIGAIRTSRLPPEE
jgi:divalent metal cation (Fe/Co/Zn/Cd) transporter